MARDMDYLYDTRHRGYRIAVYSIPVAAGPSILDGTETNYVAAVEDSLHPGVEMESLPHEAPDEAIADAVEFIDELIEEELEDLEDGPDVEPV